MDGFEAWTAFLDIYGFESLLRSRSGIETTADKLLSLHRSAEEHSGLKITKMFFFSDTIVLVQRATDEPDKGFTALNEFIRYLCTEATKLKVALRGSIAYGEMIAENHICIGKPLVEAYKRELQMSMPLVILPEKTLKDAGVVWPTQFREFPLKTGFVRAYILLPAPTEPFLRMVGQRYDQTAVDGPEHVAAVWRETHQFVGSIIEGRNEEND
jgi:hypothetical protein